MNTEVLLITREWKDLGENPKGLELEFRSILPSSHQINFYLEQYGEVLEPEEPLHIKSNTREILYTKTIQIGIREVLTSDIDTLKLIHKEGFKASVSGHYKNVISKLENLAGKLGSSKERYEMSI